MWRKFTEAEKDLYNTLIYDYKSGSVMPTSLQGFVTGKDLEVLFHNTAYVTIRTLHQREKDGN